MNLKSLPCREGLLEVSGARISHPKPTNAPCVRQSHFWDRAASRRRFLQTAVSTSGLVFGTGLIGNALAGAPAGVAEPRPIPGGLQPLGPGTEVFHFFLPERGNEPSVITDFNGFVGVARITGYGTGTDPGGNSRRLFYDADMRFMEGLYIGKDGQRHRGTFAFF